MSTSLVIILALCIAFANSAILPKIKQIEKSKENKTAIKNETPNQDHITWEQYKLKFDRKYNTVLDDRAHKFAFEQSRALVKAHNEAFERGEVTYKMELNKFADMTHSEMAKKNGFLMSKATRFGRNTVSLKSNLVIPDSFDLREKGYVSKVKNQGYCGSCWAFSVTGALEGQLAMKTGNMTLLSEQNLLDCSGDYGNEGCDGGLPIWAYQYIIDNKGLDTSESYPYKAYTNSICKYDNTTIGVKMINFAEIPEGDEEQMKIALVTKGPVSVAIQATFKMEMYKEGIFFDKNCSGDEEDLNHAVLVVGYGTDETGNDYWIVKNSWSEKWGENGYVRMARNKNHCGIASWATYPLI